MKFTLSWLKDHLDTDADARTVADKLTSIGLEVEAVEDAGARLKDFIVGHVVSAEKHPNADKLKLCHGRHRQMQHPCRSCAARPTRAPA